jgi:hypothetical protein
MVDSYLDPVKAGLPVEKSTQNPSRKTHPDSQLKNPPRLPVEKSTQNPNRKIHPDSQKKNPTKITTRFFS